MIKVNYSGRLGNSLLQYAFARILSKELGQYLPPHPIVGFPHTYDDVNIDKKNNEKDNWLTLNKKNFYDIENVKKLMETRKNISIGAACASYKNFKSYKKEIREEWYNIEQPYNKYKLGDDNSFFIGHNKTEQVKISNIEKDDLIIHFRLGDIASGPYFSRFLPFEYFDIILRNIKMNRLFITSDSPQHPLLKPFDKYSPIYFFQSDPIKTFNFIRIFNRIVLSQSSYSWWAAFLSQAEEIYYPITQNGQWVVRPKNDEDLRVDEDRYVYVSQKHSKIMGKFNEVTEW